MSYFDEPVHSTGALTTALSAHASDVKGVGRRQTVSVFFCRNLLSAQHGYESLNFKMFIEVLPKITDSPL